MCSELLEGLELQAAWIAMGHSFDSLSKATRGAEEGCEGLEISR